MLQAYTELQPFSLDLTSSSNFKGLLDLSAAPILFHLQSDPELLEYIRSCQDDAENLNSKQVMEDLIFGWEETNPSNICRHPYMDP
jgi:hypothetical protein